MESIDQLRLPSGISSQWPVSGGYLTWLAQYAFGRYGRTAVKANRSNILATHPLGI